MQHLIIKIIFSFFLLITINTFASEKDEQLNIHVHYYQESDSWKIQYQLPLPVNHITFSRQSNFDRTKLYKIDETKFKWVQEGDVLLIKSIDGNNFNSLNLSFASYYNFIPKDYTHNIKYSDGSVLLYTNHLTLKPALTEGKSVDASGMSFTNTLFHFYAPDNNIVFLGQNFTNKAQWNLKGNGTYIYFGGIKPIENENMIAIVDPALPQWAWHKTKKYFPELFDFYKSKTGQVLNFKPVVFFNYDQKEGDFSSYSGGTLDGLVQLTISGNRWQSENEEQFNQLFHFLAHEAAHFWNGQMFSYEDEKHSWMHEGGADTFANFAMLAFGLSSYEQTIKKFEEAANSCYLNKGDESLEQSAQLRRYRNYYTCGGVMGLASHVAVNKEDFNKTIFDVWAHIFNKKIKDKTYNQQDYFEALNQLTGSNNTARKFEIFSHNRELDNQMEIISWFESSKVSVSYSEDYPKFIIRHWGKKVIASLMKSHCNGFSLSSYKDYIRTYPIEGCNAFSRNMEVHYIDGIDILADGIQAYNLFKDKCDKGDKGDKGDKVALQDKSKQTIAEVQCLEKVEKLTPYLKFSIQK